MRAGGYYALICADQLYLSLHEGGRGDAYFRWAQAAPMQAYFCWRRV